MISDNERREVAAKLRELDEERIAGKMAIHDTWVFSDVLQEALFGKRLLKLQKRPLSDITQRLADLIEPSVDRDALLELADEIGRTSRLDMEICGETVPAWYAAAKMENAARRIREALGVES